MNVSKLIVSILVLIMTSSVANAQHAIDSTATKKVEAVTKPSDEEIDVETPEKKEGKKAKASKKEKIADTAVVTSEKAEGKKAKGKKEKDNTVKLDSTSTRADSINANLPKKLRDAKPEKASTAKNEPAPKTPKKSKLKNIPEGAIIPGAEEKANAETKDKLDRTMKGPSGQRVYASPKGGRYYFDINGNKKFIRNDSGTE